jgi:hypothetical protein
MESPQWCDSPVMIVVFKKEVDMHRSIWAFGMLLLLFTADEGRLRGADRDKSSDAPKEENAVAYDSKTRGALQVNTVSEKTGEWFDVLQDGKNVISGAPQKLNTTVELAPGAYVVRVNRTERKISIEAGKKTVLLTGELVVQGPEGSSDFYALNGKEKMLASAEPVVNSPTALFAGKYTVTLFGKKPKDLGEAEVIVGKRTVVKP